MQGATLCTSWSVLEGLVAYTTPSALAAASAAASATMQRCYDCGDTAAVVALAFQAQRYNLEGALATAQRLLPIGQGLSLRAGRRDAGPIDERFVAAAARGDAAACMAMLARGVSANSRTYDGKPALYAAAAGGHAQLVARLLKVGASQWRGYRGETPMQVAKRTGSAAVTHVLLERRRVYSRAARRKVTFAPDAPFVVECVDIAPPPGRPSSQ